jgi:hypothetical protein
MAHAPVHHDHEVHEDKDYGDPTPASTAYVALIGVLIFVLVIIYLQALYYSSEEKEFTEKITDFAQERTEVYRLKQQAAASLEETAYHHDYADGLGRVTIPVHGEGGAIEKLLAEWPNMPAEHQPPQPAEPATSETQEASRE